ncbi:MAG: hypothetical protein ACOYOB_07375 [Myxococcota bacterium]
MHAAPFRQDWIRRVPLALTCALALLLAACSGSNEGSEPVDAGLAIGLKPGQLSQLKSVETTLSSLKVGAGTDVTVTCIGQPGDIAIPMPAFQITPKEGAPFAGAVITPTTVGAYAVACKAGTAVDATPELLTVTPGPAATIETAVAPTQIAAGEKAVTTCTGKDKYGNAIASSDADWKVTIAPETSGKVEGMSVEGQKAGTVSVSCARADAAKAAVTAASLQIVAGPAFQTVATVTPPSFVVGAGSSDVSCATEDAFGNAVQADAASYTIDAPADLTLTGKKLESTKSGKYDVTCKAVGVGKQKAAVLEVKPGAPLSMTLYAKPDQPNYKMEDTIKLYGMGKDSFGNPIPDMAIEQPAAVTPTDGVQVNGGGKSYTFKEDGVYLFSGKSKDFPTLSAELELKCDSKGPLVMFTEPKRGATLNGDQVVVVKGMVVDELSAFKSFSINDQTIPVGEDGSFSMTLTAKQGMNPIIWKAKDEWSNESNGVQTFYYSKTWYPADNTQPATSHVKNGIGFWMAQEIIDSGKHDHKNPKDLATVMEIVLGTMDFGSLLGGGAMPVDQGLAFKGTIQIQNVKLGDPAFNDGYPGAVLTVIDGGLHMVLEIHKFEAEVVIQGTTAGFIPVNQVGKITADKVIIEADLLITLDPATGKVTSEAKNTKVKMDNFGIELSGITGTLLNWLINYLEGTLETLIEQVMQQQLGTMIGDTLGQAFEMLALDQDLPLSPFIGTGKPVNLKIHSALGLLWFKKPSSGAPGIVVGLDASVTAPKNVEHDVLGSIGRAGCLQAGQTENFVPGLDFPLVVGLNDDFINQLLHSVWNGGLLKLKIGSDALGSVDLSTYGIKDLAVDTDFWLPPILNTCIDKDGKLKLQIGDMGLHATLKMGDTPVDLNMFATMQATATLKAVDNKVTGAKELGFALESIDYVELEVVSINKEAANLKDVFVSMIKTMLLPKLVESLGSGLGSFPLPAIDLSSFSPSIPAGTQLALDITEIVNDLGYTYLRGKVK